MLKRLSLTLLMIIPLLTFANGELKGIVTDKSTQEPLIGVIVSSNTGKGTVTGIDGDYVLSLPAGRYLITFSLVGYAPYSLAITLDGAGQELNVSLDIQEQIFDDIVISASLFERRASEEVISIEVISPEFLQKNIITNIDDAARKVPGLNVVDGQANIRAGSGWAYGVGSRVGLVIDGQSALTPERQEIRWQSLPLESVGQIEVMKGASSVLYGSSAMNGTIHMQSIKPSFTPYTRISAWYGIVGKPARDETKWWRMPRMQFGTNFVRAHKSSNKFEYLVSGALYNYQLYYQNGEEQTARISGSTKWTNPKDSLFSYGIKGNIAYTRESDFFFWQNDSSGVYRPEEEVNQEILRIMIDPYMVKYDRKGNKHDIKTRFYTVIPEYNLKAMLFNLDYQFSRAFVKRWNIISGAGQQIFLIPSGDLGSTKSGGVWSLFGQVDKKFNKLSVTGGMRLEIFKFEELVGMSYAFDKLDKEGNRKFLPIPLMRFGLNYQAGKQSFIRYNIGQAFRFPSFAERFADADAGVVKIFPNPDVIPEFGWTTELGFEQKFFSKNRRYKGSFDVAFFWQEYSDLIEFLFNAYPPDSLGPDEKPYDFVGFRAENISRARIGGYEVNYKNSFTFSPEKSFNFNIGYTYSLPIDLNYDTSDQFRKVGVFLKAMFKNAGSIQRTDENVLESMLKYRNRHMITFDFEYNWKGLSVGIDGRYYSFMEGVDDIFALFIPGILRWRDVRYYEDKMTGDLILNGRINYTTGKHTFGMMANNFLNREYMLRPARPDAPVNFMLQYAVKL
jgi:outer membrane receptor protein involved in Fe transport